MLAQMAKGYIIRKLSGFITGIWSSTPAEDSRVYPPRAATSPPLACVLPSILHPHRLRYTADIHAAQVYFTNTRAVPGLACRSGL